MQRPEAGRRLVCLRNSDVRVCLLVVRRGEWEEERGKVARARCQGTLLVNGRRWVWL